MDELTCAPGWERLEDVMVVPLDVPGFERLDPRQRIAAYFLAEAALQGDRIAWDLANRHHLEILFLMEDLLEPETVIAPALRSRMQSYLQRIWLNRGNHGAESGLKFLPDFSREELRTVVLANASRLTARHGRDLEALLGRIDRPLFDPGYQPHVTCKSPESGEDVVTASSVSYYEGFNEAEVLAFHGSHPLNSSLVKTPTGVIEEVWRTGEGDIAPGRYAGALEQVCKHLEAALPYLDSCQGQYFRHLIRFFRTGNVEDFRDYNRVWVSCETPVDAIVGFIEQYVDPLGQRGHYEGTVYIPDPVRDKLMRLLAANAAYFESRMPWDPAFSRVDISVPLATACNIITLSGGTLPRGYSGVNLPNETRLRESHGSKSLMVSNIPRQRAEVMGNAFSREFSPDDESFERATKYGAEALQMFVAMHEVIGHGSGRMSPDCPEEPEFYLREYNQTLEEARADLVALWHFFDPRLLELGLISCPEVAEEGMALILRRSLTIIGQLPQPHAEEDHDRAELLITGFLRQETDAVEVVQQNGRTFWKVRDLAAMRAGVGKLLADLMRIKATGDYQAIHDLVERYAVRVDPDLHRELRDRIHALKLPEYVAFVNPRFELIRDEQGALVDAKLEPQRFEDAQRALSRRYREAEGL